MPFPIEYIFFFAAFLNICISAFFFTNYNKFIKNGQHTTARIIDSVSSRNTITITVVFKDQTGQEITSKINAPATSEVSKHDIGTDIEIIYLGSNPNKIKTPAAIKSFKFISYSPLLSACFMTTLGLLIQFGIIHLK